jgi:PAS domain S-box-containing protein
MDQTVSPAARAPEISAGYELLDQITRQLNLGNSLEEVFDLIYTQLRPHVPYNRIAVALLDEKGERLSILVARSDDKMILGKGYSGVLAGSSLEPLFREGRVRVINDLQDYLRRKPESESTRLIVKEGMRSSLTLPLLVEGKPIGVMFFSSREKEAYRPEHEALLRGIANHVAVAVERSRLIDALREKTEYMESVLNGSAEAIIVESPDGRVTSWNEGARRIYGYDPEEVIGRPLEMLVPEDLIRGGELGRLRERVQREGFVKDYETERLTEDGRRITVSVTSTAMRNRQGRVIGRSIMHRDVTQLKKLQQDLINTQSLAAVGELAATVAHEIKNPLAGISGAIQVFADGMAAKDPRREVIGEILDQIRRLDNTVRDLLTFARPAAPSLHELAVEDSLRRAWTLLSQQPGAERIRFSIEGADGLRAPLDPHLMHQVWLNLFQNAVEAMPKGGELLVRVSRDGNLRVEVRDAGTGIETSNLPKVFRPFYSTKTRGTGLGLAITQKIVEAHGGRIWVESEPKKGTSFFVEIPR